MPNFVFLVIAAMMILCACAKRDLRGTYERSEDGRTYLVIADDNGGSCGPMKVDGREWRHAIGEKGAIDPGVHLVGCGDSGAVQIEVRAGTTFRLDYWGP